MKEATCIAVKTVIKGVDMYLGVSRRDDYTNFGLIGGKLEPEDESPEAGALRELKEETGLEAESIELIDKRIWKGELIYCYEVIPKGGRFTNDYLKSIGEGITEWVTKETLYRGSFGEYNKIVLEKYEKERKAF